MGLFKSEEEKKMLELRAQIERMEKEKASLSEFFKTREKEYEALSKKHDFVVMDTEKQLKILSEKKKELDSVGLDIQNRMNQLQSLEISSKQSLAQLDSQRHSISVAMDEVRKKEKALDQRKLDIDAKENQVKELIQKIKAL